MISSCFCLILTIGCAENPLNELSPPDKLVLYSIDGYVERDAMPEGQELLHGFAVLGKKEIGDAALRQSFVDKLSRCIDDSGGELASCFWPRHALRISRNGKTEDYVICFKCLQVYRYQGNKKETLPITRSAVEFFDQQIEQADLPKAQKQ
jgi:hypothetical protein